MGVREIPARGARRAVGHPLSPGAGGRLATMPKTQDRLSLDDCLYPAEVLIPEGTNGVLTNDVVEFQLVLGGLPVRNRPTDDGWTAGFWLTLENGAVLAGIRVGPGGTLTPAVGKWAVWIRVIDNPLVPTAAIDVLTIT